MTTTEFDRRYDAVWPPPPFTIRLAGGTQRNCYSETLYEIVSPFKVKPETIRALAADGLFGVGQELRAVAEDEIEVTVAPETRNRLTGAVVPDVVPQGWRGELLPPHQTKAFRYVLRRICDSGD